MFQVENTEAIQNSILPRSNYWEILFKLTQNAIKIIPGIVESMRGRLAFSPYKSSPETSILHLMTAIAGTIQQNKKKI